MVKPDGKEYKVILVIVESLASGGELFFYISNSGYLPEPFARFYFRQMINGIEYMHHQGVAHRDLKPDNVLLDDNFQLKIADFGFAAPLMGRYGSGYLRTKCGTKPYMAPEIHADKPYKGEAVDLFASAIILFIMVSGTPPFNQAKPDEYYYKYIYNNNWAKFWPYHYQGKPSKQNFYSDSFKDLIQSMLAYEPSKRFTL